MKKKRQAYIGLFQSHPGGAIEHHYGHSDEEIFDSIHRIHGSFDISNVKIKKGKHHD